MIDSIYRYVYPLNEFTLIDEYQQMVILLLTGFDGSILKMV